MLRIFTRILAGKRFRLRLSGKHGVTTWRFGLPSASLLLLVAILQCVEELCCACAGADGAWAVQAAPHSRLLQLQLRGGGAAERQGRANAEKRATRESQQVTDKESRQAEKGVKANSRQAEKGVKANAAQRESEAKEKGRGAKSESRRMQACTHTLSLTHEQTYRRSLPRKRKVEM